MERAVKDIPIHLLSPPIPFLLPWSPAPFLLQWFCCEKPFPVLKASQHLLGDVAVLFYFFGSEILRQVGGREEIPGLREASPPLGQQQAEKQEACWRLDGAALPTAHSSGVIPHLPCFLCYQAI